MAQFDDDAQLDRLDARSGLDLALKPKLADAIVRLHEIAERSFDHGGFDGMSATLRGVRKDGREVLDLDAVERLSAAAWEELRRWAGLLDDRRARGLVRHGQGDLHLCNISLRDGQPVLFDCIEFNPALACGDILYDLAFLLMNLHHRGLTSHANGVLNRNVENRDDIEGLTLLPLFLATHAVVRAMTSATAVAAQRRAEAADVLRVEARQHLGLAQTLIAPPLPLLADVGGPSGAGKTTLARCLAASNGPAPGALILRSDVERRLLLGFPVHDRPGQSGYSARTTRNAYRTLAERACQALQAGHGVIVDAVYGEPAQQAALLEVARANRVRFAGLWLAAPLEIRAARIDARTDDESDATVAVAARQMQWIRAAASWTALDASRHDTSVLQAAWRVLGDFSWPAAETGEQEPDP